MDEMIEMTLLEIEEKMEKAIDSLRRDFSQVRTGRANPSILDFISIDYYGVKTPVKQVAGLSVPEANQIVIKPYDKSVLKLIEAAINASDLGLTPQNDGSIIRLIIPKLTEERRRELAKSLGKYEENAKVAIRNVRRDGNDAIKKMELPEDQETGLLEDIQKMTDKYVSLASSLQSDKEKELMTV